MYALAGTYSLAAYGVAAVAIGLVVLCFAEVGSRFGATGGPYLYTRVAFGPLIGLQVGRVLKSGDDITLGGSTIKVIERHTEIAALRGDTHVRASPAIILLTLTAVAAGCAAPQTLQTAGPADVKAVWTAQVDAWNRGDLEGFMAGYWKSPDLVFFSSGTETRGWQPTLDRYRAAYQGEGKQMGTLDFPQLDLVMLGSEAALVRARWRLKMSDGKESTGMTSVIFRKLPEGWRIVHDHSSAGS